MSDEGTTTSYANNLEEDIESQHRIKGDEGTTASYQKESSRIGGVKWEKSCQDKNKSIKSTQPREDQVKEELSMSRK